MTSVESAFQQYLKTKNKNKKTAKQISKQNKKEKKKKEEGKKKVVSRILIRYLRVGLTSHGHYAIEDDHMIS